MAREEDDEFGLSSSDEADVLAELVALEQKAVTPFKAAKREADEVLEPPAKRQSDHVSSALTLATATAVLRKNFGLQTFRLKQAQAITRLLDGESCVVVFPTGGGKSLCYQVPAVAFKEMDRLNGIRQGEGETGITVVVSPLIALMKDQVDALKRRGISAAVLDSTKTHEEYLDTVDRMRNGTLDILYCAPERLNNEGFVMSMTHVRGGVRLLAVDEAHCISEWGHAFRPDYLKVARFAKEIGAERVVCLTATATNTVAEDVCKQFGVPEDGLFRTTTYRPNLKLMAQSFATNDDKFATLVTFLRSHPGSTIVYTTTQKDAEKLATKLRTSGFNADHFHAGVDREKKASTQDRFMASNKMIIVATIAFGMGIDKANIRSVVHYVVSKSLEGYSQEIGRAGRDGLQSYCFAFLCGEDMHLLKSFAIGDLPARESVASLLHDVFSTPSSDTGIIEMSLYHQERDFDIKSTVLKNIYAQLELGHGLLRETTPKYTSYKFSVKGAEPWDGSPASSAIRKVVSGKGKWKQVDVDKAVRAGGLARGAIVSKLSEWHDGNTVQLEKGGVLNQYRLAKPMPTSALEKQAIIDNIYADLESRESQDLDRLDSAVGLLTGKTCYTRALAQHFGDTLPEKQQDCGHCTWCETKTALVMSKPPAKMFDHTLFEKVCAAVPSRDDARYLARIAFGISSPRATKEKAGKHEVFGSMEDHDFAVLLEAFKTVCAGGSVRNSAPRSALKLDDSKG